VFFRRVSTTAQDLAMQASADLAYRKKYIPEETLIINENGVSANKLTIKERPEMTRIIGMIKSDQIDTIYAFDRTRLFRDFYEANYFVSLCIKHSVKIFFTSAGNGNLQATGSILVEGVMNIVSDLEGKNIARRTEESRRRYPPFKLGYIKVPETKQYKWDPAKKDVLKQYFSAILKTSSLEELEVILNYFKKRLETSKERLLKIAIDPFYAGYELSTGKNKLDHVAPYISLDEHSLIINANETISTYTAKVQELKNQELFNPYCGICQKPLIFRFDVIEGYSWYSCSRKHSKVLIRTEELSEIITMSLKKMISHFNAVNLLKDSKSFFKQVKKPIENEIRLIDNRKDRLMEEILLNEESVSGWRNNPHYDELSKLEAKRNEQLLELISKQNILIENKEIVKSIQSYLSDCSSMNPFFLTSILINNLYIFHNKIDIEANKFDYLKNLKKEYTYKGDELH
jgi:DNA invertase Pin-like site-specific DNA recombinase